MPLDNKSELFYLVDADDNVLGSVARGIAHSDKTKIHRSVSVIITNSKNQMLLQKRSKQKTKEPEHWTVACTGHVDYGETYLESALRELGEEVGIQLELKELGKITVDEPDETEINMIYLGIYDKSDFDPDTDEVEELRWVDLDKLADFISENPISMFCKTLLKHTKYI